MKKRTQVEKASGERRIKVEFAPAAKAVRFPVVWQERAPRKPGLAIRFTHRISNWFPAGEEVQCRIWGV